MFSTHPQNSHFMNVIFGSLYAIKTENVTKLLLDENSIVQFPGMIKDKQ